MMSRAYHTVTVLLHLDSVMTQEFCPFQLIEEEEFNKFLVKCNLLYTQSKVKEIFSEIDSNGTGTIDFIKALHVSLKIHRFLIKFL